MEACPNCGFNLAKEKQYQEDLAESWFAEFWSLYPRHVGKAAALKAWKRAATSERIKDEIMAGLRAQLRTMITMDKCFIPHASTWLNGKRWEDDPQPISALNRAPRSIACQLCGDTGTVSSFPNADTMALAPCSCARGALPGLETGVYRVSTGERLGDVSGLVIPQLPF